MSLGVPGHPQRDINTHPCVQMSGLVEVWTEASLFGDRTAQHLLATGKPYTKAIRGHKLTWQAMWRLLIPRLRDYMKQHSLDLYTKLNAAILVNDDGKTLEGLLLTQELQGDKKAVQRNCGTKRSVLNGVLEMVELVLALV